MGLHRVGNGVNHTGEAKRALCTSIPGANDGLLECGTPFFRSNGDIRNFCRKPQCFADLHDIGAERLELASADSTHLTWVHARESAKISVSQRRLGPPLRYPLDKFSMLF